MSARMPRLTASEMIFFFMKGAGGCADFLSRASTRRTIATIIDNRLVVDATAPLEPLPEGSARTFCAVRTGGNEQGLRPLRGTFMPTTHTKEVASPEKPKAPPRPDFQRLAEILEEEHRLFEPGPSGASPRPSPAPIPRTTTANWRPSLRRFMRAKPGDPPSASRAAASAALPSDSAFSRRSRAKACFSSSITFRRSRAAVISAAG